ncbi:MAG: site-2 protease family protein [Candidatus Nomurabacteria bacterium]|nr:site-2 protease family protein [Candidatus Saccharibacteria bacterium]USN95726.1 MAG: site-2 protease family protein [Candidatus Nomurabacteria bacterium]
MLTELGLSGILIFLLMLIISLSFHEAMHAFASHWLGDTTAKDLGRLTLNPLKHVDPFTTIILPLVLLLLGMPPFLIAKPVPFNPYRVKYGDYGAALVGLAGPLSNFLLAIVGVSIIRLSGVAVGTTIYQFCSMFIQLNIAVFVFNMIPFPPLDGSRVLYAFAPDPLRKVMQQIESFGLIGIFIFMFVLFPLLVPVVNYLNNFFFQVLL